MWIRSYLPVIFLPLMFLPPVYSSYSGEAFVEDDGFFDGAPPSHEFHENHLRGIKTTSWGNSNKKVVDVMDFGAKDESDATQAFKKAWKKACSLQDDEVILLIPKDTKFLLKPVTFSGPCNSTIIVMVKGNIFAPKSKSDWKGADTRHWIMFHNVNHLHIKGGGTFYGNGDSWWKDSCKIDKSRECSVAPTALTFYSCVKVRMENLRIKDSQQIHISIEKCRNVKIADLSIVAPKTSPNTDGIHVARTTKVHVSNSVISTGDDCISIVGGTHDVRVNNITCGPGHGISIGSLGWRHQEEHVSGVVVDGVKFYGTSNGVRIKTWQGGRGYARNISFQNIEMHDVRNPIIIDQNYCDSKNPCHQQKSAVKVSDVRYKNIKGTSATEVAIRFDCSENVACHGLVVQDVKLLREGGRKTKSFCYHAKLLESRGNIPVPCG